MTNQRMRVYPDPRYGSTPRDIDAAYGWDTEGRMTSLTGPDNGPVDSYAYDAMGRLSNLGATYGPAGELLTFNNVTRTYNSLGQVTRMTRAGVMDVEYRYTAGQNNGRIWQSKDYVTAEEVTYTYDALNRLSAAQTTDAAWGQAYGYDGWGNLLSKSVTKGTGPVLNLSFDPSLNMPVGSPAPWVETGADGEGRQTAGRAEMTTDDTDGGAMMNGSVSWDPSGKKVMWAGRRGSEETTTTWYCEIYFHAITGQRLARYRCEYEDGSPNVWRTWLADRTQHVGGQLTAWNGNEVTTDRLGSVRNGASFYPYGEAKTGSGAVYAGLESPVRKYDPTTARFDRPDPLGVSAVVMGDPGSWNRFAYVGGDPVNYRDPLGLYREGDESEISCDPELPPGTPGSCLPNEGKFTGEGQDAPCGLTKGGSGLSYLCLTGTGSVVTNAKDLLKTLADSMNPMCSDWLSTNLHGRTLKEFMEGLKIGAADLLYQTSSGQVVNPQPGGVAHDAGYDMIVINDFISGHDLSSNFTMLIHEIAHLLNAPYFLNNDGEMDAKGNLTDAAKTAQQNNQRQIDKNCGATVNR